MALSTDNTDIAYLAGRYFAVICHAIGYDSVDDADHANCSTRPSFITRLHSDNRSKITPELDAIITEIFAKIPPNGLAIRLSMDQQDQYFIGHYHQRAALRAMQAGATKGQVAE